MRFSTFFAASGFVMLGATAAAVRVPRQEGPAGFNITYAYSSSPSPRPGTSQYCGVIVNVTDPITGSKTHCEGKHGPCVGNNVDPPKPELPLDADHPVACADPAFSFYLASFDGIGNYSIAVSYAAADDGSGDGDDDAGTQRPAPRLGITGLINEENYPGFWRYSCGGSGFCNSAVSGTVISAPFVDAE